MASRRDARGRFVAGQPKPSADLPVVMSRDAGWSSESFCTRVWKEEGWSLLWRLPIAIFFLVPIAYAFGLFVIAVLPVVLVFLGIVFFVAFGPKADPRSVHWSREGRDLGP